MIKKYKGAIIAQKFIKEIDKGDRRIILIDGDYVGSVARIPKKGSIKANFHAGGSAQKTDLVFKDSKICKILKPYLKNKGLFFTGIDVIGNYLTEINVTSPTGMQEINKLNTVKLEKIFCAGLDLDILIDKPILKVREFLERLYVKLWDLQYNMGKPTIAVVNGSARGGGMTLAISCDVIIASENASFGYPEINLGLPPAIHFIHLPKIVGRYKAFELLFSGRVFDTKEAFSIGLINKIVSKSNLNKEAENLALIFSEKSANTIKLSRAAFMRANDFDYRRSVANAVEDFCNATVTPDAQEGLKAFLEKRNPKWG